MERSRITMKQHEKQEVTSENKKVASGMTIRGEQVSMMNKIKLGG